jgi:hypothetical protein
LHSVQTFIVRVWLPDRPGALGAVASRIGAVRGDVVGIEILERGAGRAIDELAVQLPDASLVSLLIAEISQVDGVDVEDVRPASHGVGDPRLDALETAALLVAATTQADVVAQLVDHAARDFDTDWCVMLDPDAATILGSSGDSPAADWLSAFVGGARSAASPADAGPDDVAWADLPETALALVLGRKDRPFRTRERRQLKALVAIAAQRCSDLVHRDIALTG